MNQSAMDSVRIGLIGATQSVVLQQIAGVLGAAYLVQDLAFVQSLLSDCDPAPDMRVGLEAQRIAAAVYHAARTGEEVHGRTFGVEGR
jgi:predicted dehydrogenase